MSTGQQPERPRADRSPSSSYLTATVAAIAFIVAGVGSGILFLGQPSALERWGTGATWTAGIGLLLVQALTGFVIWRAVRELHVALLQAQRRSDALAQVDQEGAQIVAELERRAAEQARLDSWMATLSVPLIRVTEQIVIAPLLGTVDQERLQRIRANLLQGIDDQRARVALIDLTGVSEIDPQSSELLAQLLSAIELMGCQVVLTGIGTQLAQALLERGTHLQAKTYRDVMAGLSYALELTQR